MKKILSLACVCLLFTFSSCIDIIEEIFLNKDGSGKYVMTMDMKSLLGMKDMLLAEAKLSKTDSAKLSKSKADTVIYFRNMPDSIRKKFSHPELIERALLHISADEDAGTMFMALEFPFGNIEEVNHLQRDIGKMGKAQAQGFGVFGFLSQYKVSKKSIERVTLFENTQPGDSLNAFTAAMFGNARVKTVYHLPGKVKSTTIGDAYIRGNECMVEVTFPELTTRKKSIDGKVIYK